MRPIIDKLTSQFLNLLKNIKKNQVTRILPG